MPSMIGPSESVEIGLLFCRQDRLQFCFDLGAAAFRSQRRIGSNRSLHVLNERDLIGSQWIAGSRKCLFEPGKHDAVVLCRRQLRAIIIGVIIRSFATAIAMSASLSPAVEMTGRPVRRRERLKRQKL